ncbi:cobalt/nickel transport system permease protein [Breoghania corrubedonensis]|uniref:Cobalt/nickel transport system permease protein n=1 Tax=Breoghania corrubedonensis TaxID=665038 RepID=A0A2T5VGE6_9HYPH|nr:cobalt ECF transporter T component CbiQ [Breoghania corrubedonensis]PTW62808.1 cobalt/nickel transport system permease protein [Breoghania corrubedonensis]
MGARAAQLTMIGLIVPQDLRLRLVAAFLGVAALSQLHDLHVAAIALAAVVLMTLAAGIERRLLRRLIHVEGFVLLLLATLPFAVEGHTLFTLGPLAASAEGFARAGLVACKVSAAAFILMLFLGAVEASRLGAALQSLRVPETIVRLLVMTVRYLTLIRAEAHRLRESMRARAFHPRSNRHTWRSYGYLIGMLLVRALERAQRVEEAMRCRGYSGRFPYAAIPAPAVRDWLSFAVLTGLFAAALLWDRL